jgi:hypothetical protein
MFSLYRERSLQKKGHNFIVSMNTCIKYCSKKGQGKVSVININAKFSCHIHISQYTLLQFYNASAVIDLCNHFHPSIYVTFLVYFFSCCYFVLISNKYLLHGNFQSLYKILSQAHTYKQTFTLLIWIYCWVQKSKNSVGQYACKWLII